MQTIAHCCIHAGAVQQQSLQSHVSKPYTLNIVMSDIPDDAVGGGRVIIQPGD